MLHLRAPRKCHNELLETHTFVALQLSYSDEVILLRIPIRIALHQNRWLEPPVYYTQMDPNTATLTKHALIINCIHSDELILGLSFVI